MRRIRESTVAINAMSRSDLIGELRRIAADRETPLSAVDVSTVSLALWRAVLRQFGSVENARRAAGLPHPLHGARWNEQTVIREIQRLSRTGIVITYHGLRTIDRQDLLAAIKKYVGSIVRARRLARVPDPARGNAEREAWDDGRVIREILMRHRDGEPLAGINAPRRLVSAGMRYFGSWQLAIEAAGLDYDQVRLVRPPFEAEEILERLRRASTGRPAIRRKELYQQSYATALVRKFGSLDAALRRAGLEGSLARLRDPAMSADQVIRALRARRRAKRPTHARAVQVEHRLLWYSAMIHFGDWDAVLEAARLSSDAPYLSWSRDSILAALRLRAATGRSLKPADMRREAPRLYKSAQNYFDNSYLAAVREVGDAPWAVTRWTRDSVLRALRRRAAGSRRITVAIAGSGLARRAQYHFGSFSAACHAAGLATERDRAPPRRRAGRRS